MFFGGFVGRSVGRPLTWRFCCWTLSLTILWRISLLVRRQFLVILFRNALKLQKYAFDADAVWTKVTYCSRIILVLFILSKPFYTKKTFLLHNHTAFFNHKGLSHSCMSICLWNLIFASLMMFSKAILQDSSAGWVFWIFQFRVVILVPFTAFEWAKTKQLGTNGLEDFDFEFYVNLMHVAHHFFWNSKEFSIMALLS